MQFGTWLEIRPIQVTTRLGSTGASNQSHGIPINIILFKFGSHDNMLFIVCELNKEQKRNPQSVKIECSCSEGELQCITPLGDNRTEDDMSWTKKIKYLDLIRLSRNACF